MYTTRSSIRLYCIRVKTTIFLLPNMIRIPNLKVIKEYLINFLTQATQNPSELKYVIFHYVYGVIFGILLWKYVILELCFGGEPFWILYFVVIAFGRINEDVKWKSEANENIFYRMKVLEAAYL